MSKKDVKKIVFCSLDEYKATAKEENTEYIIDAKDISEAITNSESMDSDTHTSADAPVDPNQEPDHIWMPEFYINYKIENLPEDISIEYLSNLFEKKVNLGANLNQKEFILDNNYFDFDNIRYNSIHISAPVGMEPRLSYHNLIIPIKEGKLPYILSQGKKISIDYKMLSDIQLDYPDINSEEEHLDPATKFKLTRDGFVTNIFAIKRSDSYDETLHEDKKEAFEQYKQKQLEYFKIAEKKVSLDLSNISSLLENGPYVEAPPFDYSGNSFSASTINSNSYVNPFEGIPFNKRNEVKVRFRKISRS